MSKQRPRAGRVYYQDVAQFYSRTEAKLAELQDEPVPPGARTGDMKQRMDRLKKMETAVKLLEKLKKLFEHELTPDLPME